MIIEAQAWVAGRNGISMRDILQQIIEVQPVLHAAGTVSSAALRAIAAHAARRTILHSVETGCGATTLLLSHLSQNHTCFALDIGGSVASVRSSPLLRPGVVRFVEGPSQLTLPKHRFENKLQLALIDGPHAYPFPDLEYYYLYPHLDTGALLVLDDIHIPSIHNLFEFLRADRMFQLEGIARTTALFTRTDAPTFDPYGDGWESQGYNRTTLWRYNWRAWLHRGVPRFLREKVRNVKRSGISAHRRTLVKIVAPNAGDRVDGSGAVSGAATLSGDMHLWVLVRRRDVSGWWPQGGGPVQVIDDRWSVAVKYGEPEDSGRAFEIAAAVVSPAVHERWLQWTHSVVKTGTYPPVQLPSDAGLLSVAYRRVRRR